MKAFIRSLALFIPFSLVVYIMLIILWGNYAPAFLKKNMNYPIASYGHMFSRIRDLKGIRNVDVLILGSSHAYRGFDTRIFNQQGFYSFNLGSSAQTPIQTRLLTDKYIDQIHPEFIIYEVWPEIFESDGVESSLDLIANDHIDVNTIKMAFQINNIKTYNCLIYGLYREVYNKNGNYTEEIIKGHDTYIAGGGYVEKDINLFKKIKHEKTEWRSREQQVRSFESVIETLKQKGIPFYLVQAPVTQALYNSCINNSAFDTYMSSMGPYLNFNQILHLDDSLHFYDADHLNQNGVEVFNMKVIEMVLKQADKKPATR
jgi:hypothetical protein